MKVDLSSEEITCLLFWYSCYQDEVQPEPVDKTLLEKLRKWHNLDRELTGGERKAYSGIPKYQPGEKP
jgi:hypothetical protein